MHTFQWLRVRGRMTLLTIGVDLVDQSGLPDVSCEWGARFLGGSPNRLTGGPHVMSRDKGPM